MIANGSDGCDSTGAITEGSAAMPRAKLPVKHMPTTPTPGPPQRRWASAASALHHDTAGDVSPFASTANSLEMHAGPSERIALTALRGAPGTPNRWGSTDVQPSSTTRSANSITFGVMPGISAITITAGPTPRR
ncbi:MAG: hypothetical protein WKF58_03615 [Ilumatobacteraceae bacterium]